MTIVYIILAALGVVGVGLITLKLRLRGGGEEPKRRRMRYRYSDKAQQLAGNPAGGSAPSAPKPRLPLDLGVTERAMRKLARSATPASGGLWSKAFVDPLASLAPPPDASDFKKHFKASPLKLDPRFLKKMPKPAEQAGADAPADEPDEAKSEGEGSGES